MKICLVCPYDYSYPSGVANHIANLERHLSLMGNSVKIVCPYSKRFKGDENIYAIGRPIPVPSSGSVARIAVSFRLATQMNAIFREEEFDIVHIHEPFTPFLAITALLRSPYVNVGTFHAFHGTPRAYYTFKPLLLSYMKRLQGRIAVSKPARDFVAKVFPGDYQVIPNGIEFGHFSAPVEPIKEFADGKKNILFVGRLERRKGLIYLLKAFKQVKARFPDTRLIIVGPGARLRNKYENWVRDNDVPDVVFCGLVSYESLPRYYRSADIFCAPATGQESFGIVLLEAMAAGRPVIASDIPGYASVLDHGVQGLLVRHKNADELAEGIARLLGDPDLCRGLGARGVFKASQYNWPLVTRRVIEYYEKVLGKVASPVG